MRNDEDICRDVEAELQWSPSLDDRKIQVSVTGGIVTLIGEVRHLEARAAAEDITKRVPGVQAIASELVVKPPPAVVGTDLQIAEGALRTLRRHVVTTSSRITPVVQDGWVVLTGHVTWICQKTIAEHAVRMLSGVKGVRSELVVTSALTMADIKHRIEEVLKQHAMPAVDGGIANAVGSGVQFTPRAAAIPTAPIPTAPEWEPIGIVRRVH